MSWSREGSGRAGQLDPGESAGLKFLELGLKWVEVVFPGWTLESDQGGCLRMETSRTLGWALGEGAGDGEGGGGRDPLALAFTPQVTSAPPLLCQSEGGSWVLVGMAVRGSRELFATIGPEEAWISQIVGEAHFLPPSGSPYWPPEGSYLCPLDMAGSSGSPPAALFLLLLLTPLIQG